MVFEDRVSAYPNTYAMTDENGNVSRVLLERADEPVIPGTPLNAETFNKMAEDIKSGTAPAGYGLGGYGESITISDIAELDNITANGWYGISIPQDIRETADFGGVSVSLATMRVDSYSGNICRQTLYPHWSQTAIIRYKYIGVDSIAKWSPWYVENPPMEVDKEYRTTERWKGATVYVRLFDCGSATNGRAVAHGLNNCEIVRYDAGNCPFFYGGEVGTSGQWNIWVAISTSHINIYCGALAEGTQLYCKIYYTK